MPRARSSHDFQIHVDTSCLNTPMDEETSSFAGHVETDHNSQQTHDTSDERDSSPEDTGDLHPSIETDDEDVTRKGEQSYVDHSDVEGSSHLSDPTLRPRDGDESSSQHEGTDEDVFTDKSPRSSLGSYDASSESGKGVDADNMTTATRSPRTSDVSQYDKEEGFVPTARGTGTPRPSFRTSSDVRAMHMSSPAGSVVGSPRSARKHFTTASRLGTPSASAQYSPKRKSTPPRFKSQQEAPLVLLHVTLLPLRWMWGDLVNNLDPADMSEQAKTLRNSWRILQDRVGDTVIERGVLLGHPQNDYEVLEERLLEALDLPVRRRARILECGHYLGPSNESTIAEEEESEDEIGQQRRNSGSKRKWCGTCNSEIRYDPLGNVKVFRVKVYASNGLMRAGAWEACWKEMERVDVELEPLVEPPVQDEIVRLAALQQEREIAQQDEAEDSRDAAMGYDERRRSGEHQKGHSRWQPSSSGTSTGEGGDSRRGSKSSHRRTNSYHRTSSTKSSSSEAGARRYQSAGLPELILQSVRVLLQDRRNLIIIALSGFVLMLSLRSAPSEPPYEPIIHRLRTIPEMQPIPIEPHSVAQEPQPTIEPAFEVEVDLDTSSEVTPDYEDSPSPFGFEPLDGEAPEAPESPELELESHDFLETPSDEQPTSVLEWDFSSVSTIYEHCEEPTPSAADDIEVVPTASSHLFVDCGLEGTLHQVETTIERKVVRVVHTVTTTRTHTQIETQTDVETATADETVRVKPTDMPEPAMAEEEEEEGEKEEEEKEEEKEDVAAPMETETPNEEAAEADPLNDLLSEFLPQSKAEVEVESEPETTAEAPAAPAAESEYASFN